MAELTSTNVYGKLNVTRELQVTTQHLLKDSTDRPGLLQIEELEAVDWNGIQLKGIDGQLWSLMSSTTSCGIYDDTNSEWAILCGENGGVDLYNNGQAQLKTISTGIEVQMQATTAGDGAAKLGWINWVSSNDAQDYLYTGFVHASDNWSIPNTDSNGSLAVAMKHYKDGQAVYQYGHIAVNAQGLRAKINSNSTDATAASGGTWRTYPYVSGSTSNGVVTGVNAYSVNIESNLTFNPTAAQSDSGLNATGTIRSTSQTPSTSGAGLEMAYATDNGYLQCYDRSNSHYNDLYLSGASTNIRAYDAAGTLRSFANATYAPTVSSSAEFVINDDSADIDFRVESNTYTRAFFVRASDSKVGMGEMSSETEATYKMFNLRYSEANSGTRLSNVGQVAENAGMFIYNDYTVNSHASIDFQCDTNYTNGYGSGRFGWYGYGSTSSAYNYWFWTAGYTTTANWELMRLTRDGVLHVRSDVVAYSSTITSDERLKKNVVDLEDNTLDKIMRLRPVTFEWKDETKRGEDRVAGLIAQEVESIFPELIYETTELGIGGEAGEGDPDPDETQYKHIRYNELVPYLTKAVQTQQEKIDNQQKEIDTLKEQMAAVLEKIK